MLNIFDVFMFVILFNTYSVEILNKSFQLLPENLASSLNFGNFPGSSFKFSPEMLQVRRGGLKTSLHSNYDSIHRSDVMNGWAGFKRNPLMLYLNDMCTFFRADII